MFCVCEALHVVHTQPNTHVYLWCKPRTSCCSPLLFPLFALFRHLPFDMQTTTVNRGPTVPYCYINPNSLDSKGSCWILKDFYCSVTMLREVGLKFSVYTINKWKHVRRIFFVYLYRLGHHVMCNSHHDWPPLMNGNKSFG